MILEKDQIKEIAGNLVEEDRIPENRKYDWVDIVGIPQRPEDLKRSFYFTSHSTGEGGWDYGYDRRPSAAGVARDKGWDLVIDQMENLPSADYLKVTSLDSLAKRLYEAVRAESDPYIIGVTGSVGKTTTVAFLEHLISSSGIDAKRFYSKRLTPPGVMCHYINRVDQETPVVVMEYSAYIHDHVAKLSKLLPPNIAFLINIYDTHINPGSFVSKNDIFQSKIKVRPGGSLGFVNNRVLAELREPLPAGWSGFDAENGGLKNPFMPSTLRTAELFTVGRIVAEQIGLPQSKLKRAFETFEPQEKRILSCNFEGKNIFFHGETSSGGRLWSWFETTDGSTPWLFVDEINFADEDPAGFTDLLNKVFGSDKTVVLDTPANRERLPVNAHFVDPEKFGSMLRKAPEGYIIYHKALATRQPGFAPEKYLEDSWG